jgi:hypothetical protein
MKIKKLILYAFILLCIAGWGPFSFLFQEHNKEPFGTQAWINKEIELISKQANNIDPHVLKLALKAYIKAREQGIDNKKLLTVIDYSKPSSVRRLWVIDLKSDSVLYNTWVSHGKNSGRVYTTSFSNKLGSLQSSYGVFLTTDDPYVGDNGYSLRLVGLEPGINDNAYKRDIVFHGAWYVNPDIVKKYGQLGRSWGCPAVSDHLAKPLIDTIKEKTLVFAYTNDHRWIQNSPYLNG